jgi:anhydro-N-acetylmuramic acid kinase
VNDGGRYAGLISGTSRDGVDAALVRFEATRPVVEAAMCRPYPDELGARLTRVIEAGRRPAADETSLLDNQLAAHFAAAAKELLSAAGVSAKDVVAIGSHGQTVWHAPSGPQPESIQLGDPARIARLTGITTVGGFRTADIEAGGQGAPLAPLLHRALFRPARGRRAILNLGGIANVSLLDSDGAVTGYDTGPANCLLDAWIRRQRGERYDNTGAWAAGGQVLEDLLQTMLAEPWFAKAPPKSTGVEHFNLDWLARFLPAPPPRARDVQATLAELSAASAADAIRCARAGEVLVCGGGVHNADLMQRLSQRLPGIPVESTARHGLDPDWVEAVLFAWLARERLENRPQDTGPITGATRPVLLGAIHDPVR